VDNTSKTELQCNSRNAHANGILEFSLTQLIARYFVSSMGDVLGGGRGQMGSTGHMRGNLSEILRSTPPRCPSPSLSFLSE
jgi:hypothetical protein